MDRELGKLSEIPALGISGLPRRIKIELSYTTTYTTVDI